MAVHNDRYASVGKKATNPGTQFGGRTVIRKFIKKCGMPNLIKDLVYVKGNNLRFAVKFKGPVPVAPNKGEKIRGGSLLTKSVLPVVDKFVSFQIF